MTTQEFIEWVQCCWGLPHRTSSVKKAAELMRVGENTIWQWLKEKRTASPAMLLLMELLREKFGE